MERLARMTRYLLNILIPAAGWILLCTLGPRLLRFFLPFVVGWILAMIANPLVRFLERRLRIARGHSSVLIIVLVLEVLVGLIYLVSARVITECADLIRDLPELFDTAKEEVMKALDRIDDLFVYFPSEVQDFFDQFGENPGGYLSSLVEKIATPTVTVAGNVAKGIPAALVNFVIVLLSSYFFIAERDKLMVKLHRWTPPVDQRIYGIFKK